MKTEKILLGLLGLICPIAGAEAGTLKVQVRNIVSQQISGRRVTVTLIEAGPVTAGPWALVGDSVPQFTTTNSEVYFSNMLSGAYRLDLAGNPSRSFPFGMPDTNGVVDFSSLVGATNVQPLYYTASQIDGIVGTNIAAITPGLNLNASTNGRLVTMTLGSNVTMQGAMTLKTNAVGLVIPGSDIDSTFQVVAGNSGGDYMWLSNSGGDGGSFRFSSDGNLAVSGEFQGALNAGNVFGSVGQASHATNADSAGSGTNFQAYSDATNTINVAGADDPNANTRYYLRPDLLIGSDPWWTNSHNYGIALDAGVYYLFSDAADFTNNGDYLYQSSSSDINNDWFENEGATAPSGHYFGSGPYALSALGRSFFAGKMFGDAFGLTNVQSGNIAGTLSASQIYPVRSNAVGMAALALTNLDNETFVQVQKGVQLGGTYSNWNRFGWTNTISKVAAGRQFTLMTIQDGLGAGGHLFEALLRWPTNAFPFAGYKSTTPAFNKGLIMTVSGAASANLGQDGNYIKVRAGITGSGGIVNVTNNLPGLTKAANIFAVIYLQTAGAGTFAVQTQQNGGAWTSISGFGAIDANGATTAKIAAWTNPTPVLATMRCLGASGAVSILDASMWDSTASNSFTVCQFQGNSSVAMTEYLVSRETILKPILQWWAPDLCMFSKIGMSQADCNYIDTNSLTSLFDLVTTNSSGSNACDMVLTGLYPFTATFVGCYFGQEQSIAENSYLLNLAKSRGWSFWDGFSPFQSNARMVSRGFIPAGDVHATLAGYSAFGELLVHWLSLGNCLRGTNYYGGFNGRLVGAFVGDASGATNLPAATQTPWGTDINGNQKTLSNVFLAKAGTVVGGGIAVSNLTANRVVLSDSASNPSDLSSANDSGAQPINSAGTVATSFSGNGQGVTNASSWNFGSIQVNANATTNYTSLQGSIANTMQPFATNYGTVFGRDQYVSYLTVHCQTLLTGGTNVFYQIVTNGAGTGIGCCLSANAGATVVPYTNVVFSPPIRIPAGTVVALGIQCNITLGTLLHTWSWGQ